MLVDSFMVSVEFNGIVVFSCPDLLEVFQNGIAEGENILTLFTQTDLGDQVVDAGLVIPIINIDDGGYLVRFFLDEGPTDTAEKLVTFSDQGYVLTVKERLYVADAAVFLEWHTDLGWNAISVPPGNYSVTVEGVVHLNASGQMSETGYDLILSRVPELPIRTARIREDSRVPFEVDKS